MDRKSSLTAMLSVSLMLYGCGGPQPMENFKGYEFFAPESNDVIAPQWVHVTKLRVDGKPAYDAIVEVAVRGKRNDDGSTRCELITSHVRFRQDRNWSPLPIAFYTPEYESPDGKEDLNDLFRQTLDFGGKTYDKTGMSFQAVFTRGKVFTANWRIYPYLITTADSQECHAVATLERSAQVGCTGERCGLREVVAHVSGWRHLTQSGKSPREMDDLTALELRLEELDWQGIPDGKTFSANVPEFR